VGKSGDIATWPRKAGDETDADRVGCQNEHYRDGAGVPFERRHHYSGSRQDHLGLCRDKLGRRLIETPKVADPAIVDREVAAGRPTQLLQPLCKGRRQRARFRIALRGGVITPTRRTRSRCCACVTSGGQETPDAATPPRAAMISRRLMLPPKAQVRSAYRVRLIA
jgi:hypothetical protein